MPSTATRHDTIIITDFCTHCKLFLNFFAKVFSPPFRGAAHASRLCFTKTAMPFGTAVFSGKFYEKSHVVLFFIPLPLNKRGKQYGECRTGCCKQACTALLTCPRRIRFIRRRRGLVFAAVAAVAVIAAAVVGRRVVGRGHTARGG